MPTCNITQDPEGKKPFERYWGKMQTYRSSDSVTRVFCKGCGANVFWDGDARPAVVDVAVGLMDAESGARAEEWLGWWTKRVSYEEEALNKGLMNGLKNGLAAWGKKNNNGADFIAEAEVKN